MVTSKEPTVAKYLASLPADRRAAMTAVRKVILDNLPEGYQEGMQFGMIGYCIPLSRFPDTYNGQPLPIAALASQKGHMSLYLMGVYGDPGSRTRFEAAWKKAGKKLDMGKSCVRFTAVDDLALDVLGDVIGAVTVEKYLEVYAKSRSAGKKATARKR